MQLSGPAASVPFAGDDRATPATFRFPNRHCHAARGVARRGTAQLCDAGPNDNARADAAPGRPAYGADGDPKWWFGNTGRPTACHQSDESFPPDSPAGSAARGGQPWRDCPASIDRSGNISLTTCERHDAGDPSSGSAGRRPTRRAEVAFLRGLTTQGGCQIYPKQHTAGTSARNGLFHSISL